MEGIVGVARSAGGGTGGGGVSRYLLILRLTARGFRRGRRSGRLRRSASTSPGLAAAARGPRPCGRRSHSTGGPRVPRRRSPGVFVTTPTSGLSPRVHRNERLGRRMGEGDELRAPAEGRGRSCARQSGDPSAPSGNPRRPRQPGEVGGGCARSRPAFGRTRRDGMACASSRAPSTGCPARPVPGPRIFTGAPPPPVP
jgi:hypothetical protein